MRRLLTPGIPRSISRSTSRSPQGPADGAAHDRKVRLSARTALAVPALAAALLLLSSLLLSSLSPDVAATAGTAATDGAGLDGETTAPKEASPEEASTAGLVEKVRILTATRSLTALPENEPGEIDLTLVSVPGAPAELTRGVTARGFTRYVKVEDALIGQLVLSAVEKKGKREALDSAGFAAQFDLAKPELEAAAEIEIEGDAASLIAALERLAEEEEADTQTAATGTGTPGGETASSNAGSNDEAAAYTTPEALASTAFEAPVVRVTSEGCSIRVDLAQLVAIQQSRVETNDNGKVTTSECEDGNERFPLTRSYSVCGDRLDLDARTATAQYRLYYTDAGGARVETGECVPDTDKVFPVTEKTSGCSTLLDAAAGTATPQASLVYVNASNAEVQVRGCAPADTPPAELTRDYGVCAHALDKEARTAFARYILYYTDTDGSRKEAGACLRDDDLAWPLVEDHNACADKVDLGGRVAYGQYRLYYEDSDGARHEAGGCTVDPSKAWAIVEKAGSCPAVLDAAAGTATPQAALVYTDGTGREIEVRDCAASSETAVVALARDYGACTDEVDLEAGKAFARYRLYHLDADGSRREAGECRRDGEIAYQIKPDYAACEAGVDLEAREVTAFYRFYYTDGEATRREVGECMADPERVFEVVETREACSVYLDFSTEQAVPRAALVYTGAEGREVRLRGCEASEELAAVPLLRTTASCTIRHDFEAGVSYRQSRSYYELEGVVWDAGACADDGTQYPHERVYEAEGGSPLCTPVVSVADGDITLQSRLRIAAEGTASFITECTPDTEGSPLSVTTQGCTNPALWAHDLSAGVSYGEQRFYYTWKGTRTYVTDCQQGGETYPHHVETTGWQNSDPQLTAWPLSTVYIEAPGGAYTIATNQLLTGAEEVPYGYEGQTTVATGEVWYEGCTEYGGRKTVKTYKRPDGTLLSVDAGEASPQNRGDKCIASSESRDLYDHTRWVMSGVLTIGSGTQDTCETVVQACEWVASVPLGSKNLTTTANGAHNFCGLALQGSASMSHYDQTQTRTVTQYPDGRIERGPWTNSGSPHLRKTIKCGWY